MGRKKQPAELAKVKGTFRSDRHANDGQLPVSRKCSTMLECCSSDLYKELTDRQRKIYVATVRNLLPLKILERADLQEIALYATEFDRYLKCEEDIRKNGRYVLKRDANGDVCAAVENPSVRQSHRALEMIVKISSNYGMTPVDRQRLRKEAEGEDASVKIINLVMNGEGYGADEQ